MRSPVPTAGIVRFAWDRIYRRLLAIEAVANATDGASLTRIRGWYPVPQATHLTKPIPLIAPRKGRQVPVLLRVVGDAGEPIASAGVTVVATGNGSISQYPAGSDGHGDVRALVMCNDTGTVTVNATATVEDGL
ncbi:hypothetical protein D3C72_1581650 [compost metagenome]